MPLVRPTDSPAAASGRAVHQRNGSAGVLGVVGPLLGSNKGYVTSQGEILASLLAGRGHTVFTVSDEPNRALRLLDTIGTVLVRRADALLIQTFSGPGFIVGDVASAIGALKRQPVVLHLHGGALPDFAERHPRWVRRVLRRADAMVAPSTYLAESLRRYYDGPIHVIPNVVDLADYDFRHRPRVEPRLFWMRSFHPIYNPWMALGVLARVRAVHPTATLIMGGQDKGMLPALREEAQRLGISDAVRFPGFLDASAKRAAGNEADIFISTNHIDNTPVALIEAWAMGLPVVSTNVGGVPHLIRHEATGLLVNDGDEAGMASAVLRLLGEPQLASRLSADGRAAAERSSALRVAVEWEALLLPIMRRHASAS